MQLPDFVIVGAPKCGTTSLATYLGEHPAIFMSPIKEPGYFCHDAAARHMVGARRIISDPHEYSKLFDGARPGHLRGEASTCYLFSDAAVPAILAANPAARIIALVRNPLDMVTSLHAQKTYNAREHLNFEAAWGVSPRRMSLNYRAIGRLGWQIARLKSRVPEPQLQVVVFDDLRADPGATYSGVLTFLGLAADRRTDFPILNERKIRPWPKLAHFLSSPPPPLDRLKGAVKRTLPIQAGKVSKRLSALNTRRAPRDSLSESLRREMIGAFEDDVALLGRLLGRDLRHWCEE